ncbi:MAG: ribonuclease HII [Nanoarchaeota archaeon]|nr:ribonuclease HII [Nanoarchaeota archaeon]
MALILGIDDAGRGPIIGSMFLGGVLLKKENEIMLKSEGVKDSKKLLHPARIKLAGLIKDTAIKYKVVQSTPSQIDKSIASGINLNTLEAIKTAEIINEICLGIKDKIQVIVDCPSVNTKAWRLTLLNYIKNKDNLEIICEHKADVNHPSVSAASILAKVAREESVEKIRDEYEKYGNIGSGYPSDPATKLFLKKNGQALENSGIFRKSWMTWKELFEEKIKKQSTLGEF